ncbi:polysaccharide pyruvyl transferase family protein [Dysgonomonas sp. 520]|uniref:polysaccharide pyruvyl transferase family protein n=1 Tax=Dysgonomonas sp. 520 TaxID=2302931 RepID=UPI0013D2EC1C|nr:polysaccharide pyruvyl transferase family protein [Dysgonomonas sp. 520]
MNLNLGDDLFLKILFEKYPDVRFVLIVDNLDSKYKDIFSKNQNVTIETNKEKSNLFSRIKFLLARKLSSSLYKQLVKSKLERLMQSQSKETSMLISIGGSVFIQPKKLPAYADIEYYKTFKKVYPNSNLFILGSNFGPYTDPSYKEEYISIFSNSTDVCFREKYSYELFKDIPTIRYAHDIVFSLNTDRYKVNKKSKSIGFSVIGLDKNHTINSSINKPEKDAYIDKQVEIILHFLKKGYSIHLFSFCQGEGDEDTANIIFNKIEPEFQSEVELNFYNGDIDSFLFKYASIEYMFCARFHSLILSILFSQNIYPIIYSNKTTNVLNDLGYQGSSCSIAKMSNLNVEDVEKQIKENHVAIDAGVKESADSQFEKLNLYL